MSNISDELKLAEEKGIQKGIQKGIEQERMRVIQNILNISGSKHVAIELIKNVMQVSKYEAEVLFNKATDKTVPKCN